MRLQLASVSFGFVSAPACLAQPLLVAFSGLSSRSCWPFFPWPVMAALRVAPVPTHPTRAGCVGAKPCIITAIAGVFALLVLALALLRCRRAGDVLDTSLAEHALLMDRIGLHLVTKDRVVVFVLGGVAALVTFLAIMATAAGRRCFLNQRTVDPPAPQGAQAAVGGRVKEQTAHRSTAHSGNDQDHCEDAHCAAEVAIQKKSEQRYHCPQCGCMTGIKGANQHASWKKCAAGDCRYKWDIVKCGPTSVSEARASSCSPAESASSLRAHRSFPYNMGRVQEGYCQGRVNGWELDFYQAVSRQRQPPTQRQRAILERIHESLGA